MLDQGKTDLRHPRGHQHIAADTLLPTQMFPSLPARATFVADTNFVSGTQKMVLILFRNILCPQQMFPSLHSPRNIMRNNVSSTMCSRLPVPQGEVFSSFNCQQCKYLLSFRPLPRSCVRNILTLRTFFRV